MNYLTFLFALGVASAANFTIAPGGPNVLNLFVEKTGLLNGKVHHFTFSSFRIDAEFDTERPSSSRVQLVIDSASILCQDTWVSDKDLKKIQKAALENMLAASRFPNIAYESTMVLETAPGKFQVTGFLTIRDVTRPVSVSVTVDQARGSSVFKGEAHFKLTEFKLKPPSAALGLVGTKDQMKLTFVLTPAE